MWQRYTIMHKDRKVACIHKNGKVVIYSKKFMPYSLYLEEEFDLDTRVNNLENFYHWCSSRMLSLDRKYAKEILNTLNFKQVVTDRERAYISLTYHCLSLMDVYWVKGYKENISFKDVNLYENSLSNAFVDLCLLGNSATLTNEDLLVDCAIERNIATVGVAPKAWIRKNDQFYLYKDGDLRDVKAELLASKILDCFNIDHIRYHQDNYKNHLCSVSEIITSLDYSIVPIKDIETYAINHDQQLLDIVYQDSYYEYHMMNIMDYLLGNTDRHWENWGYLVDNATNKLVNLYPLMDFNKSFLSYDSIDGIRSQTMEGFSQKDAAIKSVKAVGLNQIKEIDEYWFTDSNTLEMFNCRLAVLKQ